MTLEELKIEAKNQGYKLIKDTQYEKFLPCRRCGLNRRERHCGFVNGDSYVRYVCIKCGYYVEGKTENEAKHNWNEKMRGDLK